MGLMSSKVEEYREDFDHVGRNRMQGKSRIADNYMGRSRSRSNNSRISQISNRRGRVGKLNIKESIRPNLPRNHQMRQSAVVGYSRPTNNGDIY